MIFRVFRYSKPTEKECKVCGKKSILIAEVLGVCGECIRENPESALPYAREAHAYSKRMFNLPSEPPRDKNGVKCGMCVNQCQIPEGGLGFCGLVKNVGGKLVRLAGTPEKGLLEWYYDPLPTNCVAYFVCPGCTGAGYPKYAYRNGPEVGYENLAVFYGSCTFDCLFCQNWHFRDLTAKLRPLMSAKELASKVNKRVSCICYFGGDPSSQMLHALRTSELAIERAKQWNGIMRICWETNGTMNWRLLEKAAELSFESGGCIKFDLKAWTESINIALTGVTNRQTLENFRKLGKYFHERPNPPFLIASTLLVPGYVDTEEVRQIASFLADISPDIPYSLLAFHPQYLMSDLPTTSRRHAEECLKAAKEEGLTNVHIGNVWLLSNAY
ncbi:MAG: radical SAM protein [Candidatus Baldrarchaeia archaeon]